MRGFGGIPGVFAGFPGMSMGLPGHRMPEPGTEHYKTLGVSRSATHDEIRAAYKEKSLRCHPDRGGSTDAMQKIASAKEVLLDADLREAYDEGGDEAVEAARNMPVASIQIMLSIDLQEAITGTTKKVVFSREVRSNVDGRRVTESTSIEVVVPKGAMTGLKMIREHAGHMDKGHVVIMVEVGDTCRSFKRSGPADLETTIEIPLWKALLGGCVTIPPVPGHTTEPMDVQIPGPAGRVIRPGDRFELEGMGMPYYDTSSASRDFGSLFVVCDVVFPEKLPVGTGLAVMRYLGGVEDGLGRSETGLELRIQDKDAEKMRSKLVISRIQQDITKVDRVIQESQSAMFGGGAQRVQCQQQ